jgi:hypothetical protein
MTGSALQRPARAERDPVAATAELVQMCHASVEHYQPLYGVSGVPGALRECRDRAAAIEAALPGSGRGLRMIDYGSSLGYFPFYFADRGAHTTGVDINPRNTATALACQQLNGIAASFRTGALDLTGVRELPGGAYDVALVLSVLHHIIASHGIDHVAQLVGELHRKVPTLVLELAHRDEPVAYAWRERLPHDPLEVLRECPRARVQALARSRSHLSSSTRPLFLVTTGD